MLLAPSALAADISDLGSPTSAAPAGAFPLSGFHRAGAPLRSHGRAEVLFIGEQSDAFSAMERWPMVKALEQFGRFSNLQPLSVPCTYRDATGACTINVPSFDWSSARFHSAYVSFVHRDVYDVNGKKFQSLSAAEAALVKRYGPRRTPGKIQKINFDPCNPVTTRSYPIVLIDGYVESLSQGTLNCGDFSTDVVTPNGVESHPVLSFTQIHDRIVSGVSTATNTTAADVNAEANVITALICHADGGRPSHVCGRAEIKQILRHVK